MDLSKVFLCDIHQLYYMPLNLCLQLQILLQKFASFDFYIILMHIYACLHGYTFMLYPMTQFVKQ